MFSRCSRLRRPISFLFAQFLIVWKTVRDCAPMTSFYGRLTHRLRSPAPPVFLGSLNFHYQVVPLTSTSMAIMTSDDYYSDDDDLDSSILSQLDLIEAAYRSKLDQPTSVPQKKQLVQEGSLMDLSFELNEVDFQRIDTFVDDAIKKSQAAPVAGPSNLNHFVPKHPVQMSLFGDVVRPSMSTGTYMPSSSQGPMQRSTSDCRDPGPFGQQAPKTKQWDHTAFAKTGWRKPKSKGKTEEDQEEEAVEFEQFPAPFVQGTLQVPP